jgi:8-oxo-dGTP diphosphatase
VAAATPSASLPQERLLVVAGVVHLGAGRLLVQRRPATAAHGAGYLEFPGGKVERGEGPRDALVRELLEEWGPAAASLQVGRVLEVLHHIYPAPAPEIVLVLYEVDASRWAGGWSEQVSGAAGAPVEVTLDDVRAEDFLAADREFLATLATRLRPATR